MSLETILKTDAEDRAEVEVARGRSEEDSRKSTKSQSNLNNDIHGEKINMAVFFC